MIVGSGIYKAGGPEFNPQDQHDRRRELTHIYWCVHTCLILTSSNQSINQSTIKIKISFRRQLNHAIRKINAFNKALWENTIPLSNDSSVEEQGPSIY